MPAACSLPRQGGVVVAEYDEGGKRRAGLTGHGAYDAGWQAVRIDPS